jgi:hypothetical protein
MLEENVLRAAGRESGSLKNGGSSQDYHDWQMLELERTAEQRLHEALTVAARDELAARKEVQRCTIMLDNIRRLRAAAWRMR